MHDANHCWIDPDAEDGQRTGVRHRMTATISLHTDAEKPHAEFLTLSDGASFISLDVGGLHVFLNGYDAVAVASARDIAAALSRVAAALESRLAEKAA